MNKKKVIARAYKGRALVRYITEVHSKYILMVTSKGEKMVPWPPKDVFEYSSDINEGDMEVEWGKLIPI